MATDYEKYYRENKHGLGEPTKEFVAFFSALKQKGLEILDVGCGQGRDALFIARLGHSVTAIDRSPSGIRDLQVDAKSEGLAITCEVADIRQYDWQDTFDVIVIDRTLHMLNFNERTAILDELLRVTKSGSHVLIADEKSNIPAFKKVFAESAWEWKSTLERRGFFFVQRK